MLLDIELPSGKRSVATGARPEILDPRSRSTVEPLRPTPDQAALEAVGKDLDRIQAAVAAGNTDLGSLGFWGVVARIKRDPAAVVRFADQVGHVDTAAFRARVRTRVRPWMGIAAMLIAAAAGVAAVVLASRWTGVRSGVARVVAGGAWSLGFHLPAHAFFGWLAGIRFTDAYLGSPPPPRPGIKTDYATYLRAEPSMRVWFHASGAVATKLAPFLALALWPVTNAPAWAAWALLGMGLLEITTDVLFSRRSGDWKKVARERRVAHELARRFRRF
jgi:hypothetical protein